ncbi:MAG: pyridoxal-phosphate dependent enzyme [Slackia sp.]
MTEHVSATIGATPLIKLERLSEEIGATVYVKFEASNPGGSIKDRAAMNMIDAAEDRGEIAPGRSVLVEPTSGNTGIGIAMIGAARGYDVVLTMPESMSKERRSAAYGAKSYSRLPPKAWRARWPRLSVSNAKRPVRIVGQFTNLTHFGVSISSTGMANSVLAA